MMDAGSVTLSLAVIGFGVAFVKIYVKNQRLESENERYKEKITELKEFIKDSK